MARTIGITFDYRCPFARNAHEAVLTAIASGHAVGTEIDWKFVAFSLDQSHVEEGATPVWDREPSARGTGILALEWGVAIRDSFADHFSAAHRALFAVRHDHGKRLHEVEHLEAAVAGVGIDPVAVAAEVASGRPLATIAREHTDAVDRHAVFGVPTFIEDEVATFVRFMERDRVDDLERLLALLDWTNLNELKRTRIPR